MLPESPDYSTFAPITPADWEQAILKELKGQALPALNWEVEPGVSLGPVALANTIQEAYTPMPTLPTAPAECITVEDVAAANVIALAALDGGVRALEFQLSQPLSGSEWALLLKDLQLEYISVHFKGQIVREQPSAVNAALRKVAEDNGFNLHLLRGSIDAGPDQVWTLQEFKNMLPHFQYCVCQEPQEGYPSEKIAGALVKAAQSFHQAKAVGISAKDWQHRICFDVALGNFYYVELCRLRALRWLWAGLLDAMGIPRADQIPASISGRISSTAYGLDAYDNLIRSACIGIIGISGGCQRLTITPVQSDGKISDRFARRMARNVVHLLQLESYLDKVQDPAAGSYYLEGLTEALAQAAWNRYHMERRD